MNMKKSFVLSVAAAAALFTFQGANGASAQELSQQNVQAKVAQIGNISPEQAQNLLKGQIDPQQIQELLKQQQGANSGQQQAPQGEQAQAPKAQAGQQGQPCPAQAQQQEQAQPEQAQPAKKQQAQAPVQGQATAQPEKKAANNTQKSDSQAKSLSEFEKKVVDLTNAEREKQGLKPLQADEKLSQVARAKSEDMQKNNYFDHQSPTYGSPFDMMKKFGVTYQSAGENIAMGQQTPEEVVQAWMNSEGHRKNILNPDFTHIGVGYVKDGNYWTQEFIGK